MIYPRHAVCSLVVLLSLCGAFPRRAPAQEEPLPVPRMGEFLLATTARKANLQRTSQFLDVDRIDKHLQVALLVDGTDSMQEDLESLKQNLQAFLHSLEGIRRHPVPTVSVALVVYRDTGSPDGPVTPLIAKFESRIDQVDAALKQLQPQSGAPYFREALDQGLHYALSRLNWRPAEQAGVSRWIIVAGDAPPYPDDPDDSRFRRHTDQELIALAREKQIAIYGMALGAGLVNMGNRQQRLQQTAMQERPDLRSFLGKLAKATGGHTVDVLDEASVRYWMTHRQHMPPVTEADIAERLRQRDGGGRPRIAVVPHLPLNEMAFDSSRDEVIIAAHLRQRLDRMGGIDVVPAEAVRQAWADAGEEPALASLARELDADYLIWGTQKIDFDYLVIESGLYSGTDGGRLAGASESVRPISDQGRLMVLNQIFRRLCQAGARELDMLGRMGHARALRAAWSDEDHSRQLMVPLAKDHRAQSAILAGLDELERSLAFVHQAGADGADRAQQHLQAAIGHLEQALEIDTDSPYAHLLLANCLDNLQPNVGGRDADPRVGEHLRQAYHLAQVLLREDDPVRLEITAHHALLITRDITTAIAHFRRLAGLAGNEATADTRAALRAHWMLAGIHLGDWGAISWGWDHVDPEQAREHILTILACWPDSPEAAFYRECIGAGALDVPVGEHQLARTF